jgi:hypothetical protein
MGQVLSFWNSAGERIFRIALNPAYPDPKIVMERDSISVFIAPQQCANRMNKVSSKTLFQYSEISNVY